MCRLVRLDGLTSRLSLDFSAVMASLQVLGTRLVCFDTSIIDLSEQLVDPVEVLLGVQLGGVTDINTALAYCLGLVSQPVRTNLILISFLFERGNVREMLPRAVELVANGVNLIVLLALSDDGSPFCDQVHAQAFATLGCPVFAYTADEFPDLVPTALAKQDTAAWVAGQRINLIRAF